MIALRTPCRWLAVVGLLATGCFLSVAVAATAETAANRSTRAVEIARLRFKLYERVDYPLRVRQMQTEIKLMEARAASLRRRVKEMDRFRHAEGLFTTIENLRLELLEAELRLKDGKHELTLLQIHDRDERRLRQLLIEDARRQAK